MASHDARPQPDGLVRPLDADAELLRALEPEAAALARRHAVADLLVLARTASAALALERADSPWALLVLEGVLVHRTRVAGDVTTDLVGTGDVIARAPGGPDSVAHETAWSVLEPARVAVLDADFLRVVARWPPVVSELMARGARRTDSLAVLRGIARVRQLELRLLLTLWHLADRWGRVRPDGTVLSLALTQQLLAELVAARRPSVNAALKSLVARGSISMTRPTGFVLHGRPPVTAGSALERAEAVAALADAPLACVSSA